MMSTGALTFARSAVQFQSPRELKVAGLVLVMPKRRAAGGAAHKSKFTSVAESDFATRGGVMIDQYSRQTAVTSPSVSNDSSFARASCASVSRARRRFPYSSPNAPLRGGIGERKIIR